MGDLEAHLIQAEKDINETIPDENFNGIAVIDIEEFRPMWELSWGPFSVIFLNLRIFIRIRKNIKTLQFRFNS